MIIDTIENNGIQRTTDIEYKGNFTINFKSKEQLEMLQKFFGVRRSKFDMTLLDKRPELLAELKGFNHA